VIYDVAVIGGGPAGTALAAALVRRGRTVAVCERSRFESMRIGETLGAEVEPLLRTLGAWDDFAALPQLPFRIVQSAWGSSTLSERSSITNPFGDGFHVDRTSFDIMLARVAERAGATLRTGVGLCRVTRHHAGFRIHPRCGQHVDARFVADASGRGAPATSSVPNRGRWISCDRLIAVVGRLAMSSGDPHLLIESSEDGWWYVAPQPDGTAVVALMTDSDLTPAGDHAGLISRWHTALARTEYTAARIRSATLVDALRIVRADTGYLNSDHAPGFCAVGDAAIALDPLAGTGVARALRSAIEAADAIDRALDGDPLAPSTTAERFAHDLDRRARYYVIETRWPTAPFWARRQISFQPMHVLA
jgi:flavin-dependent dehydrogenase